MLFDLHLASSETSAEQTRKPKFVFRLKHRLTPNKKLHSKMAREQEQDGKGWESGDKGTGSRKSGYRK